MEESTGAAGPMSPAERHGSAAGGPPPPPSPLSGCYLLIIIGEPYSPEHRDIILQRVAKGFLSWDITAAHVDLEKELQALTAQAPEGEEARNGERLIQYATENLVTEVLIHPQVNTLQQCVRNLLSSFTRHRHLVHAGYTFAGTGSWCLQDGTFSLADFIDAFQETEVQRVLRAYENCVTVDIHCSPEGDWTTERLGRESFSRLCKVRVNPDDCLTAGSQPIANFINYLSPFLRPASIEQLLEPSDVVGNIRFSHPTLYVFPGGQGDAALFGINGFNMLVDGGFARKACFWDFARHLDRLDAVLITRLNNGNVNGISAVLRRKKQGHVYPQIGHFFCNVQERRHCASPDGDKDRDPLLINLADEGHEMVVNLRQLQLRPHACYREGNQVEPVNLYHKVGHGKLDMYIISPSRDSREVKDFLSKWNSNDPKLFGNVGKKDSKEFHFPLQNLISICALLVWQPANPNDTITRILFPGSTPQHKIFEGLEKLRHLEFLKFPICSARSLSPSASTVGISSRASSKQRTAPAVIDKLLPGEGVKSSRPTSEVNKHASKAATIPVAGSTTEPRQTKASTPVSSAPAPPLSKAPQTKPKTEKAIKTEPSKPKTDASKPESEKTSAKTEKSTKVSVDVTKTKVESKSKVETKTAIKSRTDSKPPRSTERKIQKAGSTEKRTDMKSSPTTPKKSVDAKVNGSASKSEVAKVPRTSSKTRPSPSATPAKSTKEANNRKVVESKYHVSRVSTSKASTSKLTKKDSQEAVPKSERKPISRRPKTGSPTKTPAGSRPPGSPAKSSSAKSTPTPSVKSEKDGVIRKPKTETEKLTTDSSAVSTPSTVDPETALMKAKSIEPEEKTHISMNGDLTKEEKTVVQEIEDAIAAEEAKVVEKEEDVEESVQDVSKEDQEGEQVKEETEEITKEDEEEEEITKEETVESAQVHEAAEELERDDEEETEEQEDKESEIIEEEVHLEKRLTLDKEEIEATEEEQTEDMDDMEEDEAPIDIRESLQAELEQEARREDVGDTEVTEGVEDDEEEEYLVIEKEEVEQTEESMQEQESLESHIPEDVQSREIETEDEGELQKHLRDEADSEKLKRSQEGTDIKMNGFHHEVEEQVHEEEIVKELDVTMTKSKVEIDKKEDVPKDTEQRPDDIPHEKEKVTTDELAQKENIPEETKVELDSPEGAAFTTKDEKKIETIPLETKEQIQEEVQEIISSATEIVTKTKLESEKKSEVEGPVPPKDQSKDESVEDKKETEEVSSISPEEKLDASSEKNKEMTDDTRDTDQKVEDQDEAVDVKETGSKEMLDQKYPAEESQPDEKFSTTVESAATTAPTLPEDERIPLDEIKEIVEEKYVKEETKEKEKPIEVIPRFEQPTTLPQVVIPAGIGLFDQHHHHPIMHRDIVKTPDEVADLPVHEEVDPGMYDSEEYPREMLKQKQEVEDVKSPEYDIKEVHKKEDIRQTHDEKEEIIQQDTDRVKQVAPQDIALQPSEENVPIPQHRYGSDDAKDVQMPGEELPKVEQHVEGERKEIQEEEVPQDTALTTDKVFAEDTDEGKVKEDTEEGEKPLDIEVESDVDNKIKDIKKDEIKVEKKPDAIETPKSEISDIESKDRGTEKEIDAGVNGELTEVKRITNEFISQERNITLEDMSVETLPKSDTHVTLDQKKVEDDNDKMLPDHKTEEDRPVDEIPKAEEVTEVHGDTSTLSATYLEIIEKLQQETIESDVTVASKDQIFEKEDPKVLDGQDLEPETNLATDSLSLLKETSKESTDVLEKKKTEPSDEEKIREPDLTATNIPSDEIGQKTPPKDALSSKEVDVQSHDLPDDRLLLAAEVLSHEEERQEATTETSQVKDEENEQNLKLHDDQEGKEPPFKQAVSPSETLEATSEIKDDKKDHKDIDDTVTDMKSTTVEIDQTKDFKDTEATVETKSIEKFMEDHEHEKKEQEKEFVEGELPVGSQPKEDSLVQKFKEEEKLVEVNETQETIDLHKEKLTEASLESQKQNISEIEDTTKPDQKDDICTSDSVLPSEIEDHEKERGKDLSKESKEECIDTQQTKEPEETKEQDKLETKGPVDEIKPVSAKETSQFLETISSKIDEQNETKTAEKQLSLKEDEINISQKLVVTEEVKQDILDGEDCNIANDELTLKPVKDIEITEEKMIESDKEEPSKVGIDEQAKSTSESREDTKEKEITEQDESHILETEEKDSDVHEEETRETANVSLKSDSEKVHVEEGKEQDLSPEEIKKEDTEKNKLSDHTNDTDDMKFEEMTPQTHISEIDQVSVEEIKETNLEIESKETKGGDISGSQQVGDKNDALDCEIKQLIAETQNIHDGSTTKGSDEKSLKTSIETQEKEEGENVQFEKDREIPEEEIKAHDHGLSSEIKETISHSQESIKIDEPTKPEEKSVISTESDLEAVDYPDGELKSLVSVEKEKKSIQELDSMKSHSPEEKESQLAESGIKLTEGEKVEDILQSKAGTSEATVLNKLEKNLETKTLDEEEKINVQSSSKTEHEDLSASSVLQKDEIKTDIDGIIEPHVDEKVSEDISDVTSVVTSLEDKPEEDRVDDKLSLESSQARKESLKTEEKIEQDSKISEKTSSEVNILDGEGKIEDDAKALQDEVPAEVKKDIENQMSARKEGAEQKSYYEQVEDDTGDGEPPPSPGDEYIDSGLEEEPVFTKLEAPEHPEYVMVTPDSTPASPKALPSVLKTRDTESDTTPSKKSTLTEEHDNAQPPDKTEEITKSKLDSVDNERPKTEIDTEESREVQSTEKLTDTHAPAPPQKEEEISEKLAEISVPTPETSQEHTPVGKLSPSSVSPTHISDSIETNLTEVKSGSPPKTSSAVSFHDIDGGKDTKQSIIYDQSIISEAKMLDDTIHDEPSTFHKAHDEFSEVCEITDKEGERPIKDGSTVISKSPEPKTTEFSSEQKEKSETTSPTKDIGEETIVPSPSDTKISEKADIESSEKDIIKSSMEESQTATPTTKVEEKIDDSHELQKTELSFEMKTIDVASEVTTSTSVQKMLVTASSEDGGTETVLCATGTIKTESLKDPNSGNKLFESEKEEKTKTLDSGSSTVSEEKDTHITEKVSISKDTDKIKEDSQTEFSTKELAKSEGVAPSTLELKHTNGHLHESDADIQSTDEEEIVDEKCITKTKTVKTTSVKETIAMPGEYSESTDSEDEHKEITGQSVVDKEGKTTTHKTITTYTTIIGGEKKGGESKFSEFIEGKDIDKTQESDSKEITSTSTTTTITTVSQLGSDNEEKVIKSVEEKFSSSKEALEKVENEELKEEHPKDSTHGSKGSEGDSSTKYTSEISSHLSSTESKTEINILNTQTQCSSSEEQIYSKEITETKEKSTVDDTISSHTTSDSKTAVISKDIIVVEKELKAKDDVLQTTSSCDVSTPVATLKKESVETTRSATPGSDVPSERDLDAGGLSTPHSDISSGQVSRSAVNVWGGGSEGRPDSRHYDSDEEEEGPVSPMSVTSQVAPSPPPPQFEFEMSGQEKLHQLEEKSSLFKSETEEHTRDTTEIYKGPQQALTSAMTSSFYGSLPAEPPLSPQMTMKGIDPMSASFIVESESQERTDVFEKGPYSTYSYREYEEEGDSTKYGQFSVTSHTGPEETLDFQQALYEHRAARGEDLTSTSSSSTYHFETKSKEGKGILEKSLTSDQAVSLAGVNGQRKEHSYRDFTEDYGNGNLAGAKQFEDLMNRNRDPDHALGSKVNGKQSDDYSDFSGPTSTESFSHEMKISAITVSTSDAKAPREIPEYTDVLKSINKQTIQESTVTKATEPEKAVPQGFTAPSTTAQAFPEPPQGFGHTSTSQSDPLKDPIKDWGKPLGLPAPAPPPTNNANAQGDVMTMTNTNKGTPKKEKKVLQMKKSMMINESNKTGSQVSKDKTKSPESPVKQKSGSNKVGIGNTKSSLSPIYVDLSYVPHHGNSYYTSLEFFKKVRARYYVFSGTEPSREVYNALLEAKQTWEDKELEVTIIPTYDTDTLGYWVAENEDALAKCKIDLSPSASRCTINLQDHETSCSAYRLEF